MIDSVALTLYIKRVLREVRRHSSDTDSDRKIIGEIEARVLRLTGGRTDEGSIRAALEKMEPASELGLQYRVEYKYSAEKPDGFLMFERFFEHCSDGAAALNRVCRVSFVSAERICRVCCLRMRRCGCGIFGTPQVL